MLCLLDKFSKRHVPVVFVMLSIEDKFFPRNCCLGESGTKTIMEIFSATIKSSKGSFATSPLARGTGGWAARVILVLSHENAHLHKASQVPKWVPRSSKKCRDLFFTLKQAKTVSLAHVFEERAANGWRHHVKMR